MDILFILIGFVIGTFGIMFAWNNFPRETKSKEGVAGATLTAGLCIIILGFELVGLLRDAVKGEDIIGDAIVCGVCLLIAIPCMIYVKKKK